MVHRFQTLADNRVRAGSALDEIQQDRETVPDFVDWDQVRQRLTSPTDESSDAFPGEGELSLDMLFDDPAHAVIREGALSPERVQAILEKRARVLAKVAEEETDDSMQIVVFSLAGETYGIPTQYVKEVQPLHQISPVPCTPDFVVGAVNIRGSIYSVIDICEFLGVRGQQNVDSTKVLLIHAAALEVGILAEDVLGSVDVPLTEIKAPLAAQSSVKAEYIHGLTKDMLIILNLETLMSEERIVVHEEVVDALVQVCPITPEGGT